ncbi:uncharacterized protein LOC130274592 [Hyla sarda]|uniref:uncharacterized protein LOC130274592 n=1 Tax=Hyla sarda TaxID=327740 RepID=UPI0024C3AEDA|nr:uncharacterized protein LOC130274592 [Hyla sarda]
MNQEVHYRKYIAPWESSAQASNIVILTYICFQRIILHKIQKQTSEILTQHTSQPEASQPAPSASQQQQQFENVQMQAPQQQAPRTQGRGRGRGRSSRGRRGGSVTTGGRTAQTCEKIVIKSELLIQMVHERPALWDQTDPQHANHTSTRRLWADIFIAIVERGNYIWEELEEWQKQSFGDQIKCRWSLFRDRFIRYVGAEATTANGSDTVPKKQYTYLEQLSFLCKCTDMRKTSSNVRERQTIVEAGELASGTGEQVASQSCHARLPQNLICWIIFHIHLCWLWFGGSTDEIE